MRSPQSSQRKAASRAVSSVDFSGAVGISGAYAPELMTTAPVSVIVVLPRVRLPGGNQSVLGVRYGDRTRYLLDHNQAL
jgi:hypothetical protein